jgi:hypothetical protein
MRPINVFKPTQDEWHGSYTLNDWHDGIKNRMLVEVSFRGNISDPLSRPIFRTCVWGNDDCGMELDSPDEGTAFNAFLQVIGMENVNRADLQALGFIPA